MAYSIETKHKAIKLRRAGFSIREIARKFGITQSTSSLWLRNVDVTEKGVDRLRKRQVLAQYRTSLKWRRKRRKDHKINIELAKRTLRRVRTDRNHCRLYAAILFWCEGGKADKRGVRFINSDPILIKTFLCLFRRGFDIDEKKFRALIHLHKYHNERKQKLFWSSITQIPLKQFNRSYIKLNTGKRVRTDYPGCLAVYYHNAPMARKIKAIFEEFARKITGA